jgi:hypothetical protein
LGICLLQESEQYHAKLDQVKKCQAKETDRDQVCTSILALPFADAGMGEVARLEKKKQMAVTTMIKPAEKKRQKAIDNQKKKPAPARKKKKQGCEDTHAQRSKETDMRKEAVQTTTKIMEEIHECGCRHGDLSLLKSFTRAEVAYYTSPNRFLARERCLDCKRAVIQMKATAANQL